MKVKNEIINYKECKSSLVYHDDIFAQADIIISNKDRIILCALQGIPNHILVQRGKDTYEILFLYKDKIRVSPLPFRIRDYWNKEKTLMKKVIDYLLDEGVNLYEEQE